MAGAKVAANVNQCKRCGKTAHSGLKCIICGTISHNSCVSLLKNVQVVSESEKLINCCENTSDLDLSFASADGELNIENLTKMELEVLYLKYTVKQKNILIKQQQEYIESLKNQILLINKINNKCSMSLTPSSDEDAKTANRSYFRSTSSKRNSQNDIANTCISTSPSQTEGSTASKTDSHKLLRQTVNMNKTKSSSPKKRSNSRSNSTSVPEVIEGDSNVKQNISASEEASKASRRLTQNRSRKVIGALQLKNNQAVKTVEKYAFLHISKIHPDISAEELKDLLSDSLPEAQVEQLNSAHPNIYSSFKVSIHFKNLSKAYNPGIWPENSCVNRFFHKRKLTNQIK